ncbi:MAG: hypothetical protein K2N29_00735, partial [Ruminiclostridium sp.]|nr:hypothetical protein [Ruminiclostridium sp.]
DALAKKREPLPESTGLAARKLYHTLLLLYREYRGGITSETEARIEKGKLMKSYGIEELWERIYAEEERRRAEFSKLSIRARKEGCPICKEMAEIMEGLKREGDLS